MRSNRLADRTRWLLNRSRRKAQRRRATLLHARVGALRGWATVSGVELKPWQLHLLKSSLRGVADVHP